MATPNYEVDYNDKRLTDITAKETAAVNANATNFDKMISETDKAYNDAINKVGVMDENGNWNEGSMAAIQTEAANKRTEFAIDKIEQQKEQAKKDYTKEQAGAWVDYQKQVDPYGVNAEQRAASGMQNTGYAESSLVSMYNTYQNRVATARASYELTVQNYNNSITEARLQNNSVLAEIALDAMKQGLEFSIQSLTQKNTLLTQKANQELQIKQFYADKWKTQLDQINTENALKEQVRQADMANARQMEQIKIAQEELKIKQAAQKLDEQKYADEKAEKAAQQKEAKKQAQIKKKTQEYESKTVKPTTNAKTTTYNKAAATMQAEGAIKSGDGGLMTATEWKRRKNSGSNRAEFGFATYQDYVDYYTTWRIANPEK